MKRICEQKARTDISSVTIVSVHLGLYFHFYYMKTIPHTHQASSGKVREGIIWFTCVIIIAL